MNKKLYNLLEFNILAVEKTVKILISIMYNFAAKFAKILETCKKFSTNLVNDFGNAPRRGVIPKFSDLEVIALSMTAESESIDSENRLFELLKSCKSDFPSLISRRQYNDRRKITSGLCEQIRKRIANFKTFAKARKRVETNFSQLTDQYMVVRNYAKQTDGLFARIVGKISAQTIAQYFNYINNKPIGRVKYALI